jgi:hypothetical protein
MSEAVFFRKGIGDDAKAIEDTKYFIRVFGGKKATEAANASYALTGVYEKQNDNEAVMKHLKDYIHSFGEKGGADRIVVAHAKIAAILWSQSCPLKEADRWAGSCVKITRERAIKQNKVKKTKKGQVEQPTQCGPESKGKLTVVKRDDRKMKARRRYYGGEVREASGQAERRRPEMEPRSTTTGSRRSPRRPGLQEYLDLKFPLTSTSIHAGAQGDQKSKSGSTSGSGRREDRRRGPASTRACSNQGCSEPITAAARIGQISQNFSTRCSRPRFPGRAPRVADEGQALNRMTEVPSHSGQVARGIWHLPNKSTELGWFSSGRSCARGARSDRLRNSRQHRSSASPTRSPGHRRRAPVVKIDNRQT